MKRIRIYHIVLSFLVLPFTVAAQSLDYFLNQVEGKNLDLRSLDYAHQAALEKPDQVKVIQDPEIGLGFFPLPVETRLGAQRVRLSYNQALPQKKLQDAQRAKFTGEAQRFPIMAKEKQLEINYRICIAYIELYEQKAKKEILEKNIQLLEALQQIALSKVESGKGSAADVLRLDLQIQEWQQEVENLQYDYVGPRASINFMIGRAYDTPVLLTDTFGLAALPLLKDSLENRLQQHPLIQNIKLQQAILDFDKQINTQESKSKLGLGLDYIFLDKRSDFAPENNGRDVVQFKAMLKYPLDQNYFKAKDRAIALKQRSLDMQLEAKTQTLLIEIEKAIVNIRRSADIYQFLEKQEKTLSASLRILEGEYSAEGRSFDELLKLENELVSLSLKRLKTIIDSQKWLAYLKKLEQ